MRLEVAGFGFEALLVLNGKAVIWRAAGAVQRVEFGNSPRDKDTMSGGRSTVPARLLAATRGWLA